ncbi:hypothetical protein [Nonomuraea sp. NPDC052265]|uniref:hypothetical protein n=1 Tax=Nonomuraea sp. NPDC052265 TaxID=3364374 RepID=UPI0037C59843
MERHEDFLPRRGPDVPLDGRIPRGGAATAIPAYLCRRDLAEGTLVALAEPEEPPINTGYLAVRSGALARSAVARVRAHLLTAFRAAPPY